MFYYYYDFNSMEIYFSCGIGVEDAVIKCILKN